VTTLLTAPAAAAPSVSPARLDAEDRVDRAVRLWSVVALPGRHASSALGQEAWQAVITEMREVDRVFSTYQDDSIIRRLDRGELGIISARPRLAKCWRWDATPRSSPAERSRSSFPRPMGAGGLTPVAW
jgi:thiamine biosynthesis lipoprotein ApbE